MIWLNPAAWIAVAIVAAPVLIHLLVHRRAERFPFPTLRFIQPTRLAAIRRHVLEDIVLLAVPVAATEATKGNDSTPDYGWSGDHMSGGGSDYGGGGDFGGGGFDGGGGGGDGGGGGF